MRTITLKRNDGRVETVAWWRYKLRVYRGRVRKAWRVLRGEMP